ncbi:N-acetylmuramoyl-L-alanine amidase [Nonomuraea roseoviolacea]|uniref:N-acetylmuramoyl-L-alanine amidase n=1 Tax=Nonomuraea roseoviolacea subsp. carminata TaxID=160689 RepID=A0ABT1JSL3_9ACTN|nr:N-acetylmuramoyl-L-alanine amidase [Nonomuraea roseoviolacea]MCP2344743.1 N-acetylmuramoyl-L-alanine amidase [Nonomuraea roseoviolacea subsp. carminata]
MRADGTAPAIAAALVATLATACGGGASPPAREATTPPGTRSPAARAPLTEPQGARSPSAGPQGAPGTPTGPQGERAGRPLAGKVVVIDPGHNGGNAAHPAQINRQVDVITGRKPCNTTGTSTDAGYPEHAFTWDVARRLRPLLLAEGAKVVLTRPDDEGVGPCVTERAAIGNKARADAVLSVHGDGAVASGHGFHVILPGLVAGHNDAIIRPSRRLGLDVRDAFHRLTGLPYATYTARNGLSVRTDLGGLNLSTRPAVFIECGNMRNRGDAAKMSDPRFRQRMAAALAAGMTRYLKG